MLILDAQRDLRRAFLGGFVGQNVSGLIWLLSAVISTFVSPLYGMAALFVVSIFIYPLTQLGSRLIGRAGKLSEGNTLGQLATQTAFTVPVGFLLVAAATFYREDWFYPAAMIVVGAHYLPFVFLYGMREFGALAVSLIAGGVVIALYIPGMFSLEGWIGAILMIVFAFVGRWVVLREERR